MRIGDRVFWEDSDPDGTSGIGTVVSLQCEPVDEGTVIGIDMDDGPFVEAFRHDLRMDLAGLCGWGTVTSSRIAMTVDTAA